MASARTPGIIVTAAGNRIINKEHYGVRLFLRLGNVDQDYAEQRLHTEIARLDLDRDRKAHVHPLFRHCATRYLDQSRQKRSFDDNSWHVRLLIAHISDLEPHKVHDGTLEPFVTARRAAGAGATTINRTLEVVRTILNRAARAYRDDDGIPWLDRVPPMITMLPESPRPPCPITWDEQDRLLRRPPAFPPRHDGTICSQYRVAGQQSTRTTMDLGSGGPGDRAQRIHRATRSVQEHAPPRRYTQRRCMVTRATRCRPSTRAPTSAE